MISLQTDRMEKVAWSDETRSLVAELGPLADHGIFMTGIEGSDPMVEGVRRDLFLEAGDFYTHYRERLTRIRNLGITWLRVGPPYSKTHLDRDRYDFSWFDGVMDACRDLGITVILDLLHFGLPDWARSPEGEGFQNPDFPQYFADYAEAITRRYAHVTWFTPINEPFITASFSSRLGIWNEGLSHDRAFVRASANLARAAILAERAIRRVWKEEERDGLPIFLQNESFEEVRSTVPIREWEANLFNEAVRFVPLDLILGHRDDRVFGYLDAYGITEEEYEWFMTHGSKSRKILGIDHYPTCIHILHENRVVDQDANSPYELGHLTRAYWNRYRMPLLHAEVNAWPEHAVRICRQTYEELCRMRSEGYPVLGMSWYGDESQVDWQTALRKRGEETPVGLFRQGEPQPVAELFRSYVERGFTECLPAG
ncbi:MAG: family 1 glycosylhydrolase [Armatimonadetes bacterium]|nr:family 1 glycosylhydrolase [Armatimonadota bacterium]